MQPEYHKLQADLKAQLRREFLFELFSDLDLDLSDILHRILERLSEVLTDVLLPGVPVLFMSGYTADTTKSWSPGGFCPNPSPNRC